MALALRTLVPLETYTLDQLGGDADMLDGPFVLPLPGAITFGLLLSLRGARGGALPTPSEVLWAHDVPPILKRDGAHVFLRQDASALYLGHARLAGKAAPRTGHKLAFKLDPPLDEERWRAEVTRATAPPPPPPDEAIAALTAESTADQRLDAIALFLEQWTPLASPSPASPSPASPSPASPSPASPSPASPSPAFSPSALSLLDHGPRVLARFRAIVAGRSICHQNRLVHERDGDRLHVYVENQHVHLWATSHTGDDPPVHVRDADSTSPWRLETSHLSTFLVQVVLFEATFGAPFSAHTSHLDGGALARLARRVRPLAVGDDRQATRTRFFASDGVFGFAMPNGPEYSVWLGAIDRRHIEPLESLVASWDHVGF